MEIPYINKQRLMLIVGSIAIVLSVIVIIWIGFRPPPITLEKLNLTMCGVFDDSDVYGPFLAEFAKTYPKAKVTIHYKKIPIDTYESELINALAEQRGPDIFMIQNSWLQKHQNKLYPIPSATNYSTARYGERIAPFLAVTPTAFGQTFVPAAVEDLIRNGQIYSLPLYVDTLALFYNEETFHSVGIPEPPSSWDQFIDTVVRLTKFTAKLAIERSGVAMGTADNVNRAPDIVSLLMLQNGTQMTDLRTHRMTFAEAVRIENRPYFPGSSALEFYTNFSNPRKQPFTWDNRAPYSIDSFVDGSATMMFNYAYTIPTIKRKAPYLQFAIAPAPQTEQSLQDDTKINFASYWTLGVSRQSGVMNTTTGQSQCLQPSRITKCEVAWDFQLFMAQKDITQAYLTKTQRPTARKDLVNWQRSDPYLGVFALQSLTAHSWRQPDNDVVDKLFNEMINAVNLQNKTPQEALEAASKELNLLVPLE